jgi:hypothetical protein
VDAPQVATPRVATAQQADPPVTAGTVPATGRDAIPTDGIAAPATAEPAEVAKTRKQAVRPQPTTPAAAIDDSTPRIAGLQEESARLEALLAFARDERVGSASAVLLADALDAQVANIDAALTAPGLAPDVRESLWQARVDALQQAAGFVSTQRLLATQGQADVLLVSVD